MPGVLKRMGRHYSSLSDEYRDQWTRTNERVDLPPEKMPDKLIEQLIRSRKANQASFWLQSLFRALFDMTIHQPPSHSAACEIDSTKLWNSLLTDLTGLDAPDGHDWACGQANFGHVFQGYDAGFYSYLTSQVLACDMFYSVDWGKEEGLRWRKEILEKGGGGDEMGMVVRFLGRGVRAESWLGELGLHE